MFELTWISLVLFTTTAINCVTTYFGWQRRNAKGGLYFAWGMMGITLWTLASGFDYAVSSIPMKVFFAKVESLGYNVALPLLTLFVLSYAGYEAWLNNSLIKSLFIAIPASNILLTWTNEWHEWIWTSFLPSEFGDQVVIFEHGPGFIWISATGYLMIIIILSSLWRVSNQGSALSRRQARLLLIASFIAVASNLIYLLDIYQIKGVDWTSVTFSISGLLFLQAISGTYLLDIVPIARHEMLERMRDRVLVLDIYDRVVDFNLSAQRTFNMDRGQLGMPVQTVMAQWPQIMDLTSSGPVAATQATIMHKIGSKVFDARITHLTDTRGSVYGKLLVFSDVTKRYQAELTLEQRLAEIQTLHQDLQQTQAQVVDQQRALATQEERQRMARDLHDSVSQSIHSVVLFAETLEATLEKNNYERALQIVKRLTEGAKQSLKEVRLMLYELQDEGQKRSVDLIKDLESRLAGVEGRAGIRTQFVHEGSLRYCPREWHENLFWIAVEALNNSLKHSQANEVKLRLNCSAQQVELEIVDNGIGFDPHKTGVGGMGLKNLLARADIIGGVLTVESGVSRGTVVRIIAKIRNVTNG